MRILAKIRMVILDLVGYVDFFAKFGAKSDFRVSGSNFIKLLFKV